MCTKDRVIAVRVREDQGDRLEEIAEERGTTVSRLLREMIQRLIRRSAA